MTLIFNSDGFPVYFEQAPTIMVRDPLAEFLGAAEHGLMTYRYVDAVRLAGHSCPTVAGAYLMVCRGLKALYGDDVPERGGIEVRMRDGRDEGTTGVVASVATLLTGAAAEQGFGGIVAVGQGSTRGPRLIRISYTPEQLDDAPTVALVGKGVTFDTGGVSIKPAANMDQMISDMGGSAAVLATIIAAARLKLNVKVTATIPMAENMPGGNSYRPGDVITHYGGTTSEILNTDAEGRLILADAIARASEDNPDYLIETATLTGAQMVALGLRTAGVMGSDAFRDRVAETGRSVGEQAWAMPIPEEMSTAMSSPVADLRNADPSRWGGMLSAGYYLGNFVGEGIEWVHIDIAGPSFNTGGAHGYTPARATGAPVRTLIAVLEGIAGE